MTRKRRGRGQALTEFAIVFPIFAILMFAIIDLGRAVYALNAVGNGAREGARIGSVGNRPAECNGLSREACVVKIADARSWGLPENEVDTVVSCERINRGDTTPNPIAVSECRTDDLLRVQTDSDFTFLTPIAGQIIGDITMSGVSEVTVNQ